MIHEKNSRVSLFSGTLSSTRFSLNSCSHSGISACNGSSRACLLVLSLRVVAGRKVETTESCGDDAGDVGVDELEEPVDKPRTTIGMLSSVLQCVSSASWSTFLLGLGILIGLCNGFLRASLSSLSHSTGAGLGIEPSISCVDDVGGVGADELDGHVVLRVTLYPKTVFYEIWFVTAGPLF